LGCGPALDVEAQPVADKSVDLHLDPVLDDFPAGEGAR
jgi:hypothetical protein